MSIRDLRALIRWADGEPDNARFWRRLWCAAEAYDHGTRINIQAMCVNVGGWTPKRLTAEPECDMMDLSNEKPDGRHPINEG